MPTDSDPKPSNESQSTLQGLLSKCGIVIPTFSVRDKKTSGGEGNRSDMSSANSPEKKRKRTSESPLSLTQRPNKMAPNSGSQTVQQSTSGQPSEAFGPGAFWNLLKDDEFRDVDRSRDHGRSVNVALEEYAKAHNGLLVTEAKEAWDYTAISNASALEHRAALIIRALREYERVVIFGNTASEAIPGPDTLDMGGQFLTNKTRIEGRSKIFQIAKEVPKGALLHLHFNAELNPERLLKEANSMKNMYVWSKRALINEEDLRETEMVFDVLPDSIPSNNIFSKDYKGVNNEGGESWKAEKLHAQGGSCRNKKECGICKNGYKAYMKWSHFKEIFATQKFTRDYRQSESEKHGAGNRLQSEPQQVDLHPAENWIKQKMVISELEAYSPAQTVNGVWARFNQATRCFKGLMNYKKVYEWYIGAAIERLIDEKIMYAELRPMLLDKFIPDTDGVSKLDLTQQMQLIAKCVQAKLQEKDSKTGKEKRELFPFGLKIIYCTPRSISRSKMLSEMRDCIRLKKEFPDLICGFDLVGAEDRPNHIGHYREELVAFKATCKAEGLDIPFMFHAGETLLDTGGSSDPRNSNLFDAVALKSKRIGHGFALLKHPTLVEQFKQKKDGNKTIPGSGICIELCPISNELLHLCRNIKEHPYPELLAAGIPCCVNSDNPSLFGNSMSHEFYQIMVGSPTMSLHSWKQLAQWSLEYSCLDENENENENENEIKGKSDKARAQEMFLKSFEHFCKSVDEEYGYLVDPQGQIIDHKVETAYGHPSDPGAEECRRDAFFKQQKAT